MQPEAAQFGDPLGSTYAVWLSSAAIATILEVSAKAGQRETGGILIGRYDFDGWLAEIVEATAKPRGSRAGRWWFRRGNTGLRELLEGRWSRGHHYLGEWHFHPGGSADPSSTDVSSMIRIATDPDYQCPQPILVVLGGWPSNSWVVSASVFAAGHFIPLVRVESMPRSPQPGGRLDDLL